MQPPKTFLLPQFRFRGIQFESLCRRAGVGSTGPWTTDEFFAIWTAAGEVLHDPSVGLRFGAEGISGGYGVASIVALHATDFRRALSALGRYKRLTCPETVEVEADEDVAVVRYRWLEAAGEVPRLLVDMTLAALMQLALVGSGGIVRPLRVELARREAHVDVLRDHFGCPIVFSADYDCMIFDAKALDTAFVSSDGPAFERLLGNLEARLAEGDGYSGLLGSVRTAIARQFSQGREASIAAVSRRMNLSTRTLQRRLEATNTSFQEQLNGVRRTTASRLLANTELDPVAIAMLLGFEEPNSFTRAFRAWEHTTPLRWRQEHAASRAQHSGDAL